MVQQKQIHRSDQEWMTLINECRSSGLSDKNWCQEKSIPISTFYNRIRHLRKKACVIPPTSSDSKQLPQQVVPVTIIDDPAPVCHEATVQDLAAPAVTLYVGGCHLEINNHAAPETIRTIISALQQLC